jgi:orotate phosphoribosyltransferase-like protein
MSGLTKDELKKQGRERAARALSYRKQGLTYKWICKEMNISYSRARQLVEIAERNCSVMTDEEYEQAMADEGQRRMLEIDTEVRAMIKEAVDAEREACAKVCDERAATHPIGSDEQCEAEDCAAAIRARSNE